MSLPGRARATLDKLKQLMGFTVLAHDNAGHPVWVRVDFMSQTTWRRVEGQRGAQAVFEMEGD